MDYKQLTAIRAAIRHAKDMIEYMADTPYVYALKDQEILKIYFELNNFAIKLTEKITQITPPWEEGEG